jgi:parallel beta-helix repeat protein
MRAYILFMLGLLFVIGCMKEELILDNSPDGLSSAILESRTMPGDTIDVPGDYPTIQQAIDAASDHNKIRVAAGTYNEGQIIIDGFEGLRLGAEGHVVLNGRILIKNSSDILVRGFTINSTVTDADEVLIDLPSSNGGDIRIVGNTLNFPFATDFTKYGIRVLAENATIQENKILVTHASYRHAGIELIGSYLFVKGNSIEFENLYPEGDVSYGIGIFFGVDFTVRRNFISGAERGFLISTPDLVYLHGNTCLNNTEYGIYSSYSCETTIERNTALGNGICDIKIGVDCGTTMIDNVADCIEGI